MTHDQTHPESTRVGTTGGRAHGAPPSPGDRVLAALFVVASLTFIGAVLWLLIGVK